MIPQFKLGVLAALSTAMFAIAPAWSQEATDAPFAIPQAIACPAGQSSTRETEDGLVIKQAWAAFARGSYGALTERLPAIRAVVENAPACYPLVELRGEQIILRSAATSAETLALLMGAALAQQSRQIVASDNTYGDAALMMGAYYNEVRQHEEAVRWLDRGLALQPYEQRLSIERSTALMQLRRFQEAVDQLRGVLDHPEANINLDRPRVLRNYGIALIDVDRLDDAEAALNESIRLQPNNPIARGELEYIAGLRAGRPATSVQMTTSPPPAKR